MAGERPQPLTLPHGFHFHYTDGTPPKTPERETISMPEPPKSPPAFRVRRPRRPRITNTIQTAPLLAVDTGADTPIPTIEAPDTYEPATFGNSVYPAQCDKALLSPHAPRALTAPRTPSAQRTTFDWESQTLKENGNSIVRPSSTISSLSDSSDESDEDSDRLSYGGSCTSPESEAAEPFGFPSPKKASNDVVMHSQESSPSIPQEQPRVNRKVHWTPEMDKHIWGIYMAYIQDPTVTPFKTLPGSAPPLGVCHRVAREAKQTWRGGQALASAHNTTGKRKGSPDTITSARSGSSTPKVKTVRHKSQAWPKTSAATRRRLRELCKRKATIAPHYQRILKSRSPSPFTSSSRPTSRATRMQSPLNEQTGFARDVQLALVTSTSSTMQPNGPLAQLARSSSEGHPQQEHVRDWNNVAPAPWASPAPIPSDIDHPPPPTLPALEIPPSTSTGPAQLGSPFHYRTWGPSRSRDHQRPQVSFAAPGADATQSVVQGRPGNYSSASIPRLRSPIQLHGTFPANHKRRAQFPLEDELSPGGSGLRNQERDLDDVFGPDNSASRRRVRSRGFSLCDALISGGPGVERGNDAATGTVAGDGRDDALMREAARQDSVRQLGSPFAGISGRPSRTRRHLATASLSSVPGIELASIDSLLHQANHGPNETGTHPQ